MRDMLQSSLLEVLARFRRDETGAAMAEYGLLITLIALVVVGGATLIGTDISTFFSAAAGYLTGINVP